MQSLDVSRARGRIRVLVVALATLVGAGGCPSDAEPPAGDTTGADPSSGGGGPTDASSATTIVDGSSSTGPGGDGILQCVESCTVPSDCCLPGDPCPGAYPYNVDCIDDVCVPARCADDDDCAVIGPQGVCRSVRGSDTCVLPCTDDVPCMAAGIGGCAGVDDESRGFCTVRCDDPGEFCGNQTCDPVSGLCTCSGDGQCQSDWRCLD